MTTKKPSALSQKPLCCTAPAHYLNEKKKNQYETLHNAQRCCGVTRHILRKLHLNEKNKTTTTTKKQERL